MPRDDKEKNPVDRFRAFVEKKAEKMLSKKIPEPRLLSRQDVNDRTTKLAFGEMQRFKQEHDRLPTRSELDQIADAIYRQIKQESNEPLQNTGKPRHSFLEERRQRRQGFDQPVVSGKEEKTVEGNLSALDDRRQRRLLRHGKKQERDEEKQGEFSQETQELPKQEQTETELAGINVSDLFSGEKSGGTEGGLQANDLLGDSDLGDLEKELASLEGGAGTVSKEIETGSAKCPNCKTRAEDILFCPECGAAFCSHCAKKVENLKDFTNFTCPKCNSAFKARNKSAR